MKDTMTLPLRSSQDSVQSSQSAPFRFLDLPKEIQCRIIEATLAIERESFQKNRLSDDPRDFKTPRIYDFNINALGLRSHTLPPFGLLFVNKEVSGDALAVVYQNSSFAVYAEISRVGVPDHAFGYIPNVVKHISPMVITNAREVMYRISTISEGLALDAPEPPNHWNNPAVLERALGDLRILVDQATFPHVKNLNVVLMTQGLVQKHLNVLFKLFVVSGCVVTLEEVGNGKFGAKGRQESDLQFLKMVEIAAKQWDQDWIVTEPPIAVSSLCVQNMWQVHNTWRGTKVRWARHREWKNRKFAPSGKALPPPDT